MGDGSGDAVSMKPGERARAARKQAPGPLESLAQAAAQRVTDFALEVVDVNTLLDRIDPNVLLDHIDMNRVLDRVDVAQLLDRIDVAQLLDRIDVDQLLDRVDVAQLLDRVDITKVLSSIDMETLAEQTDFGAVITKSSGSFARSALDLMRSQAVGLDDFIARVVSWLRRRKYAGPPGPPPLLATGAEP